MPVATTGGKIDKADVDAVRIKPHRILSDWNYTLSPASASA